MEEEQREEERDWEIKKKKGQRILQRRGCNETASDAITTTSAVSPVKNSLLGVDS